MSEIQGWRERWAAKSSDAPAPSEPAQAESSLVPPVVAPTPVTFQEEVHDLVDDGDDYLDDEDHTSQ